MLVPFVDHDDDGLWVYAPPTVRDPAVEELADALAEEHF
jgi:hypothetical protein